jgi:glycosyltransferase involved in cell wall biosynthesis
MNILLLQDAVHLPSFGGGNKANRLLLTELAARGAACTAVCALPDPRRFLAAQFDDAALRARGVAFESHSDGGMHYRHHGVDVHALDLAAPDAAAAIGAVMRATRPDWVLVSDDRHGILLDAARAHAPDRVVALVHTHLHLPFGPQAQRASAAQHARMRAARGIVVASAYSRDYLREHGGLDATVMRFPVFGRGPFACRARPDLGPVTMINPCVEKGLAIFLALAAAFPEIPFAAVPTWGADAATIAALTALPNVALAAPDDDIGAVLAPARILLAPSLIPETFGYVAVDAMLRGIPVLAGNLGGQPEAMLGVDYVLPVAPALRRDGAYVAPAQDIAPWRDALAALLADAGHYARCSAAARAAALRFNEGIDVREFERFLESLASADTAAV